MSVLDNINNPAFYTSGGLGAADPTNPIVQSVNNPAPTFGQQIGDAFTQGLTNAATQGIHGLFGSTMQPSIYDELGNVDITAPGSTVREGSNPFFDQTSQYLPGQLDAATNIYNAGRPDLNPLLEAFYNDSAKLTQSEDARTQELAERAAGATKGAFGAAGTLGSARNYFQANEAAGNIIADRERQRLQDLNLAGQQYQDWQTGADWDWLNQYQNTTGFGQHVPQSATQVDSPSGVDVYNAELGRFLTEAGLRETLANRGISPGGGYSGVQGSGNWYDPITTGVGNALIGGAVDTATSWIDDWF